MNTEPIVWLKVKDAAQRARVGTKAIYAAVANQELRAARVSGRRSLRFLAIWVDDWLIASSQPVEIAIRRRGA